MHAVHTLFARRPARGASVGTRRPTGLLLTTAMLWPMSMLLLAPLLARGHLTRSRRSNLAAITATAVLSLQLGSGVAVQLPTATHAILTTPATVAALGWGVLHGGTVDSCGRLLVVSGMEGGDGPRGGVTVGRVFLTEDQDRLDDAMVRHEERHTNQWAVLGGALPLLYAAAELAGGGPNGNLFEAHAGLADGGYQPARTDRGVLAAVLRTVAPTSNRDSMPMLLATPAADLAALTDVMGFLAQLPLARPTRRPTLAGAGNASRLVRTASQVANACDLACPVPGTWPCRYIPVTEQLRSRPPPAGASSQAFCRAQGLGIWIVAGWSGAEA